ncbi:hypothetical protein EOD39_7472 [Acipenser ruthenus]|uniref:Uncharacterized protein n=1 Tax=Acipenser ruthenus TaxID=7906 RepID=A0A444U6N4_ACIRT|nr:hypothetical protein EOD39_7472 [Acipenser ruthenus]
MLGWGDTLPVRYTAPLVCLPTRQGKRDDPSAAWPTLVSREQKLRRQPAIGETEPSSVVYKGAAILDEKAEVVCHSKRETQRRPPVRYRE